MLGCTDLNCNLLILFGSWLMFVCDDFNYILMAMIYSFASTEEKTSAHCYGRFRKRSIGYPDS